MAVLPPVSPSAVPFLNSKYLAIQDLAVINNATTPNTQIDVGTGVCRDSSDVYDIYNLASLTINAANNGLNGLDTGSLAASSLYYVLLVGDPVSGQTTKGMISLSATAPLLPFGYSVFRVIGFMVTDGSSHFLLGYNSGNQNARRWTFDAPKATSVTAGTSATYAAIDLSAYVPANQDNLPLLVQYDWTANAAADVLAMHGGNSTGDQLKVIAPVAGATAHTVGEGVVLSQLVAGVPKIAYKVSAVGGVAINVLGYEYYL
jgi:hypothetical protein